MQKSHRFLVAIVVSFILIILVTRNQPDYERRVEVERYDVENFDYLATQYYPMSRDDIKYIVKQQEKINQKSLIEYKFPLNTTVNDYMMSMGGQPVRSIIVTTWRSGSTFLGDILNSIPGNYYHYEPLLDFGIRQIRGPPLSNVALSNLKNLLTCNYTDLQDYLKYGKSHIYLFTHNTRLWNQCEQYPNYCWNSTFLSEFCKVFPFQSMKTVRLRLHLAEELLKMERLNVRVLLLVRDPRGILQSRKHRDWCPGEPDCDQPSYLCNDMVTDYNAAVRLLQIYPKRFRAIRYEDLSISAYEKVQEIFDFFGLHFHDNVINFLDLHTKSNAGGVSSTFRDSKSAPFHWRQDLNYTEVQYIEEYCQDAMALWGYAKARNETHLKEMNPLTTYSLS